MSLILERKKATKTDVDVGLAEREGDTLYWLESRGVFRDIIEALTHAQTAVGEIRLRGFNKKIEMIVVTKGCNEDVYQREFYPRELWDIQNKLREFGTGVKVKLVMEEVDNANE